MASLTPSCSFIPKAALDPVRAPKNPIVVLHPPPVPPAAAAVVAVAADDDDELELLLELEQAAIAVAATATNATPRQGNRLSGIHASLSLERSTRGGINWGTLDAPPCERRL